MKLHLFSLLLIWVLFCLLYNQQTQLNELYDMLNEIHDLLSVELTYNI